MFDELTSLLDDSQSNSTGSVLITSYDFDSNFLLQHFLSYSLRNSIPCAYISLLTSFSHLKHVQSKLGQTLKTPDITPSSSLMFIPLFSTLSERYFQAKSQLSIDELWLTVMSQLIASPKMIVIEDLQILRHLLKYSERDILLFYQKLRRLYPDAQIITQISISDDEVVEGDDQITSPFITMLKRIHDKHLIVRNLSTGATKDISGQVNSLKTIQFHFHYLLSMLI